MKIQDSLKIKGVFVGSSQETFPRSKACTQCMTGIWRIMTDDDSWFHECLVGKAFLQDTRETFYFTNLLYDTPSLYPHYIYSLYPHIERSAFQRENLSHYPWEWEIVIPTILYTIYCGFSQLLPLHIQILKRLIAQTLITPFLSVKWGFCATGKYWKKPFVWRMQLGWIAWSEELEKIRFRQVSW